jgi:hypothetical protein
MGLFKRFKFGKRTKTRSYSSVEPVTPMSPMSDTADDVEEDEIDYSPCIRQEKAGKSLNHVSLLVYQ